MERLDTLGKLSRLFVPGILLTSLGVLPQSTVMLAVNVGFLAIPGVVPYNLVNGVLTITHQVIILGSLSQIASILSLESSVGSIVISLLLMRHNRTKQDAEPAEAVSKHLHLTTSHCQHGIWTVDISLPELPKIFRS